MHLAITAILLMVASVATAAPPTNCTFPQTLQAAVAGDEARPHVNETKCVVNKLQERATSTAKSEVVCSSPFPAFESRRRKVTLTAATPLTGNEAIAVSVKDGTSPAMLEEDGVFPVTGTGQIDVWVFNRDAGRQRTGSVCVAISRP